MRKIKDILGHSILTAQFSSVIQPCPTLCDIMDWSTPGFPVHHQLLELTQTHVHHVGDATQPSHPLSSPSPPAPNPSQHQSFPMSQFFTSGDQRIGVSASASVLPMHIQGWFALGLTGLISLQSKGPSRVLQHHNLKALSLFVIAFLSRSKHLLTSFNIMLIHQGRFNIP